MSKSRKKVSSKQHNNQKSKVPLIILSLAGVTLLVLAFVFASQKPAAAPETQAGGSPVLAVDQKQVDLGDVPLGTTVEVAFELTNTGSQPLRFTRSPYIEVKEGCWPPTPVIGSMTLQPGETTSLSMQFMMHAGMEGPHDFRVHIPNDDPNWNDTELIVLSNWVE